MEETQVRVCYFYSRGLCQNGDHCPFLHDDNQERVEKKKMKKRERKEAKLPIQLLGKKTVNGYLFFARDREIQEKVQTLTTLWLEVYAIMERTSPQMIPMIQQRALGNWIFASNKLDNCNTEYLDETLALLESSPVNALLKTNFVLVENTNQLLIPLMTGNKSVLSHLWCKEESLLEWHTQLQKNSSLYCGSFRSDNENISLALESLKIALLKIAIHIDENVQKFREKVKLVFALAAFATKHFIGIRPFMDGNERLSRVIMVNILDSVAPLPFPLLCPSRPKEQYHKVMNENNPRELMFFMLDCAIFHTEQFIYYSQ